MIKHVFFDRRRMLPILLLALLIAITCLFFGCALKKPEAIQQAVDAEHEWTTELTAASRSGLKDLGHADTAETSWGKLIG